MSKNCVNTKVPASSIVGPAKNRIIPKIALIEARVNWALTVLKLLFSMDINEEKNSILPIFFFLVQAQNIKQLRPWFHSPKVAILHWKKIQDTGTITIQIYYLEVYQNSLQKTNALNPDQWICNTVRRLKNLFTEQPHIYPASERGLVYKKWWGSRVGYK